MSGLHSTSWSGVHVWIIVWSHDSIFITINDLVSAFSYEYLCYGSTTIRKQIIIPVREGIVFIRQNLTSTDVRFWRITTLPALKRLYLTTLIFIVYAMDVSLQFEIILNVFPPHLNTSDMGLWPYEGSPSRCWDRFLTSEFKVGPNYCISSYNVEQPRSLNYIRSIEVQTYH